MPKKLIPSKAAWTILDIFLHEFEGRPERTVKTKAFVNIWSKRGLPAHSFRGGMEYAIQAGWVEIIEIRDSYRLTKLGYEKTIPLKLKEDGPTSN